MSTYELISLVLQLVGNLANVFGTMCILKSMENKNNR